MKKTTILLFIALIGYFSLASQVTVNTDGSIADNSAILDVKSTTQGLLIPRMTNTQIQYIANPANGLLVYSADDSKTYCFHSGENVWKELAIGSGGITPYAVYSIGTSSVLTGSIYEGVTILPSSINLLITGNVSVPGCWSITTAVINGYSFSGSGTTTSTGTAYFMLYASGTPVTAQTDYFNAVANNNGGSWSFNVTVNPAPTYPSGTVHCITGGAEIQNVYNPTTGKTWMDRNLGASQVATSSTDSDAFGDLYQWGRLSDGHQCRSSGTTTTLSSTNSPGHDNYILAPGNPQDWRSPKNDNLWQGISGINNPCPSGYRLPTELEWIDEMDSWSTSDSDGAYASPLKFTVAGYRTHDSGGFSFIGTAGGYWTSTIYDYYSRYIYISNVAHTGPELRANGLSVRCIKD